MISFDGVIPICFYPLLWNFFRNSNPNVKGEKTLKSMPDTGLDISYAEMNKINTVSNALHLPSGGE